MNADDKANILLVDDSAGNLLALEAVLDRLGENCVRAKSGDEALRHLLHDEFAVILLDAQMRGMDGIETAALIREREKSADIPIIFVTAIDRTSAQVFRGYAAGAVDYVFKPFDPEVLRSKVRVFVNLFKKNRELKRQTELLRESEERYALAVKGAADGLWDWNLGTDQIYFSPRWKAMLGHEPAEIDGRPNEWFERILPEDRERLRAQLDAHLRGDSTHFESEHRMRHRDGSVRWMQCRGLAVRDAGGAPYRIAGSLSDVTRRKMAEEELVKRERLAVIGMTIANAAHSVKNILQGVNTGVLVIEMGVNRLGSEDLNKALGVLKSSIGRLNELVMNMLDFSKQRVAVRKEIDCAALFEEVGQILAAPATLNRVTLAFNIDPAARRFQGDYDRLVRALVNLGTNAVDAMNGPERVVTFSALAQMKSEIPWGDEERPAERSGKPEKALVIEVRDTGAGIPAEHLGKIFEPFFSTKDSKGTGLGLASVREFVKEQGGTILLESVRGKGSRFRLVFFDGVGCAANSAEE